MQLEGKIGHCQELQPFQTLYLHEADANRTIGTDTRPPDRLQGFFTITPRTIRSYPYKTMANVLGYIAEISKHELNNDHENYYRMGDYIGKSGIEYSYEKELRGQRGVNI
jgi:cell division protein FtsI/penicillin-binding protein 2